LGRFLFSFVTIHTFDEQTDRQTDERRDRHLSRDYTAKTKLYKYELETSQDMDWIFILFFSTDNFVLIEAAKWTT